MLTLLPKDKRSLHAKVSVLNGALRLLMLREELAFEKASLSSDCRLKEI